MQITIERQYSVTEVRLLVHADGSLTAKVKTLSRRKNPWPMFLAKPGKDWFVDPRVAGNWTCRWDNYCPQYVTRGCAQAFAAISEDRGGVVRPGEYVYRPQPDPELPVQIEVFDREAVLS